jgi:hypothetical protein
MTYLYELPLTLDGRYFVLHGRRWRNTASALPPEHREEQMDARLDKGRAMRSSDAGATDRTMQRVDVGIALTTPQAQTGQGRSNSDEGLERRIKGTAATAVHSNCDWIPPVVAVAELLVVKL